MCDQCYRYIHLFPYEKFTTSFINFINENYNRDEHCFIVYGMIDFISVSPNYDDNVYFYKSIKDILFRKIDKKVQFSKAKTIFVHSLFMSVEYYLISRVWDLNKTNIIFWGADIHDFKVAKNTLKGRISDLIKKYVVSHAAYILTLVDNDYQELLQYTKIKGQHTIAVYPNDKSQTMILKSVPYNKSENPYRILVGNSATESNCHLEVFNLLKKFANENIEIYCPLSYGDDCYRNKVVEAGRDTFGGKFIPILDYMDYSDYLKLLAKMKVVIFNNNRQQGLGNINASFGFYSKVYLKNGTSMWKELVDVRGYQVYDVDQIESENFDDFLNVKQSVLDSNKQVIDFYSSVDYCVKVWNKILGV